MSGVDAGVAPTGGMVCQNGPKHDEGGEVKMRGGPFDGVMCPECGRHFLFEHDLSFSDPPHDGPENATTDTEREGCE